MIEKAPTAPAADDGAATPRGPGVVAPPQRSREVEKPVEAPIVGPPRARTNLTLDEVGPLWDSFRSGHVVACPGDSGSLALSVDGNNAYRLVCTRCGTSSSWFEAAPAGIRLRTIPPGPDDEAADI